VEHDVADGERHGDALGPVGFVGAVVAADALRDGQFVAGANRTGRHLRGVEHGRDFQARFADIRQSQEGDRCPNCGGALGFQTAIEVGHIFKLGTRYSEPLGAMYLDEDGREKPIVMGSYGIGPARVMAALAEQRGDDHGIAWPDTVAPYLIHIVALTGVEEQAETAAGALEAAGYDVLFDDPGAAADRAGHAVVRTAVPRVDDNHLPRARLCVHRSHRRLFHRRRLRRCRNCGWGRARCSRRRRTRRNSPSRRAKLGGSRIVEISASVLRNHVTHKLKWQVQLSTAHLRSPRQRDCQRVELGKWDSIDQVESHPRQR